MYLELEAAKAYLFPRGSAPTDVDTAILSVLPSIEKIIDEKTGRNFDIAGTAAIRYFDGDGTASLWIDDCTTVTKVEYNSGSYTSPTWTEIGTDHWITWPYNSITPIHHIELVNYTSGFPKFSQSVRITATWGWKEVPEPVQYLAKQLLWKTLMRSEQFRSLYYQDSLAASGAQLPSYGGEIWDADMDMIARLYLKARPC
jgi:hypothetical protein